MSIVSAARSSPDAWAGGRSTTRSAGFIRNSVRTVRGTVPGELRCGTQREAFAQTDLRGVCFTYATMFALEALAIAGENHANSQRVRRACEFLLGHQAADGGWGETYMVSSSTHVTRRD